MQNPKQNQLCRSSSIWLNDLASQVSLPTEEVLQLLEYELDDAGNFISVVFPEDSVVTERVAELDVSNLSELRECYFEHTGVLKLNCTGNSHLEKLCQPSVLSPDNDEVIGLADDMELMYAGYDCCLWVKRGHPDYEWEGREVDEEDVKRLYALEKENAELKRMYAEAELKIRELKEALDKN